MVTNSKSKLAQLHILQAKKRAEEKKLLLLELTLKRYIEKKEFMKKDIKLMKGMLEVKFGKAKAAAMVAKVYKANKLNMD
jgi:hypothetical protein